MRVSSATRPSFIGTLKSTRTRAVLPLQSTSRIVQRRLILLDSTFPPSPSPSTERTQRGNAPLKSHYSLLLTVAEVEAAEARSRRRGFLPHMAGSPMISFRIEPLAFPFTEPLRWRATNAVMSDNRQA